MFIKYIKEDKGILSCGMYNVGCCFVRLADKPHLPCQNCGLGAIVQPEFLKQVADVVFNRLLRENQLLRYLLIIKTLTQKQEDIPLPLSQRFDDLLFVPVLPK